jgi:anti-sigma B factor antagonist
MDFQLSEQQLSEKTMQLTLSGRLTAATAPQLRDKIAQLVESRRAELIFDLSTLNFLDSSGLASIVSGLKSTREHGGWLKLVAPTSQVSDIFKLTKLDRVFDIFSSVEEALKGR